MDKRLKILIVRLSAIGDVVHSLPVLHSLRKKYPDAYISWLVEDKAAELLINHPLLDRVIVLPKRKWKAHGWNHETFKEVMEFVNIIRNEKFDIAIDLQELFKSGIWTFLSGAKRRIAHAGTREFAEIFVNEKLKAHDLFDPNYYVVNRYLETAQYLGAPVDEVKFPLPPVSEQIITKIDSLLRNVNPEKPVITIAPATTWVTKHWIEDYWAELVSKLEDKCNIVIVGSNQDSGLISRITANAKNFINIAGETSLLELAEVFNRSDIVVAPDTGPAYIANAVDKPSVIVISGATSSKRNCPYGDKNIAISAQINCQPCHKKKCLNKSNAMQCMKEITPDKIINFIDEKLSLKSKIII